MPSVSPMSNVRRPIPVAVSPLNNPQNKEVEESSYGFNPLENQQPPSPTNSQESYSLLGDTPLLTIHPVQSSEEINGIRYQQQPPPYTPANSLEEEEKGKIPGYHETVNQLRLEQPNPDESELSITETIVPGNNHDANSSCSNYDRGKALVAAIVIIMTLPSSLAIINYVNNM